MSKTQVRKTFFIYTDKTETSISFKPWTIVLAFEQPSSRYKFSPRNFITRR